MDKGAIKTFAIEARKILMKSAATQAGFYGVTKEGCVDPIQKGTGFEVYRTIAGTENRIYGNDINKRRKLKEAVENQEFDQVIEETAYTWFNRLIAIRFMEVNGYLPTRTRVLSSETGSNTPDLVAQYLDVDLGMSDEEIEKVAGSIKDNRYDDAFALLFVKQCNALNELLPRLFETTDDYMELLLKLSYTSDGVVRMLVDTIPESSFNVEEEGQVEIMRHLQDQMIRRTYWRIDDNKARWQQVMGNPFLNFSVFAVEPEKLDIILKLIEQLLSMAKDLFGENQAVRVQEHIRKLDMILKQHEMSNELYEEERELVKDLFEKLSDPSGFTAEVFPADISSALNLYMSGKFQEGEIQSNKVGMVSPIYQIDAAIVKQHGKVHVCLCDVNNMPGGKKEYIWPLTSRHIKDCYKRTGNPLIVNLRHVMENTYICNRWIV